ncbi:uncharacterized protein B0H18DRAFT_1040397 [Fomitopsis serialis]|uniref:uncharacterized protein n=1 Tax=Fomitopsis serialis TaxID=139415 RepID=UPI0020076C00|nr:uncharacterized protein B0H18DRAFT_1040397 [Neoantrodia serialis]KAH9915680.1 hypothetical protein B0H18DRAFT_1040397 [Neoantrodia serialis]
MQDFDLVTVSSCRHERFGFCHCIVRRLHWHNHVKPPAGRPRCPWLTVICRHQPDTTRPPIAKVQRSSPLQPVAKYCTSS